MNPTKTLLSCLAAGFVLMLAPRPASAEVFRYTDRSGKSHLVNVRDDMPMKAAAQTLAHAAAEAIAMPRELPAAPPPDEPPPPLPAVVKPAPSPATAPLLPAALAPLEATVAQIPYYAIAHEAAVAYALPVELIVAVMRVESAYNPRAVSRAGAQGLMQLMPATATSLGVTDPFDPRQNIFGGALYLRMLVNEQGGDVALALAAYNAGPGAVRRAGGIPALPETAAYVPSVLHLYHRYAQAGLGGAP